MIGEQEVTAQCPYCFSPISFVLEAFAGAQSYIEDCEVCCRPIQISYAAEDGDIIDFSVERLDD